MNFEIAIVLSILAGAVFLFISGWVRMDIVALMVMVSLAATGLVTPAQALSGFSNMSVITVWAMLILSAGLAKSGVAQWVGIRVLKLAGNSQVRLIVLIMLAAGLLSGIMNNIAVVAFMIPVVIDMGHRTHIPASKLLIPLAFACLLGGLGTMIGTPSNILISEATFEFGLEPFRLFDYTPVGLPLLLAGILFFSLVGFNMLPSRSIRKISRKTEEVKSNDLFALEDQIFIIDIQKASPLAGKRLGESRLSAVLGINVIAINRNGKTLLSPTSNEILETGDQLIVSGNREKITEIGEGDLFIVDEKEISIKRILSEGVNLAELEITYGDPFARKTIEQVDFRRKFGVTVLAVDKQGVIRRTNLHRIQLQTGDKVLLQGTQENLQKLVKETRVKLNDAGFADLYQLNERLLAIQIPKGSILDGADLKSSHLGDAFGLTVLGIQRGESGFFLPEPEEILLAGDTLLVEADPKDINTVLGFREISLNDEDGRYLIADLENEEVGFVEVVLSPYTALVGKSLREVNFREKFGLTVSAIWREGKQYLSNLRDMKLRYGDALLLHGPREKFRLIGEEQDFIVLSEAVYTAPPSGKTITAVVCMMLVLGLVITGILPIAISAVLGIVLMILLGVLTMEEAYRSIEWKAVFLIAGLIPLGIALEQSGAAEMLAGAIIALLGDYGPLIITAGLFLCTTATAQIIPNPAVAVLMAPIAYNTAINLGISPYPLLMAVAVGASAAFLTPFGHPANLLVMGPGGYQFNDFIKTGLPLIVLILVVLLVILPFLYPY
ncbi:MAG: SLC13 family permease [Anaerolineales bacterium]